MTSPHIRIAIIGGGLSGLYAAHLLEQRGIRDYLLLEARPSWGGRIQSPGIDAPVSGCESVQDRFDLGPTWFWPDFQPELDKLISELGLERFVQFEDGDMVLERSPHQAPIRTPGYGSSPPSMRLVGGMATLVEALGTRLSAGRTLLNQVVKEVTCEGQHIHVISLDATGSTTTVCAEQVLLAVPPRLAMQRIGFSPSLPGVLARQWQNTPTWMAPHAKYVAVYNKPFWREAGLSGEARSARGPLGEIHDATMPGASAALFGFFAVPAAHRRSVSEQVLMEHCRAQLVRLFGPQACEPKAEFIKDWAIDELTSTTADHAAPAGHASAPPASATEGRWRGRLVGGASEWSPHFPGYIAGAIEAARLGVDALLSIERFSQLQELLP